MIWKDIPSFEGLYKISEYGDILNIKTNKLKKLQLFANGYYYIDLWKDNKPYRYSIHRLVAICFIPNPDNLPIVLHKDNNKLNCHYTNLKWGTISENTQQAYDDGLITPVGNTTCLYYEIYDDNDRKMICYGYRGIREAIGYGTMATVHNFIAQNHRMRYGNFKGCKVRQIKIVKPFMVGK